MTAVTPKPPRAVVGSMTPDVAVSRTLDKKVLVITLTPV